MTALVVGASSGLGRALAQELARAGHDLLLLASDARDLEAIAADLNLRHGVGVRAIALDLAREADPGARLLAALADMPPLSAMLLAVGTSRNDDDFSLDAARTGQLLAINLHAPLAITQALLPTLLETRGTIVLFGSIAAVRGRGRNVVYAGAKRALESLYESLRQRHGPRALRVQFYRLGFVATNLTYGSALPLAAVEPGTIARCVVRRLAHRSGRWTLPRRFVIVTTLVRVLPWWLYRKLRG